MRKLYFVLTFVLVSLLSSGSFHAAAQNTTDSCTANFETQSANSTPLGKYFFAQPWNSGNKKPLRVCWNFGDGHDTCIYYTTSYTGGYAVYHQYAQPGNYNVCVNILYDGGCEAHKCKMLQVGDVITCSANFETVSSTATALGKYFVAQPSNSANKKPVRICWTFGDNHDTCIQYLTSYTGSYGVYHQYSQPGVYNVCVNILYDAGCEAHLCKIIAAGNNDSCRADFERIPNLNNDPLRVYYRALPWNSNQRKPQRICWTFGDGRDTCIEYPENYTGQYVVAHNYPHTGTYQVCVKIKYYGGCEAQKCRPITLVGTGDCSVNIIEATSSLTSLTRTFYAATSSNSAVQRICWSFGDGTDSCIAATSSTPPSLTITHTFPGPGVYRVCVKVLYVNGCLAEKCKEITIQVHNGICGGYYTDSMINMHTYSFKGFSIHRPNDVVVSYRWTFGDGTSAVGQQVIHSYAQPGLYRVCLVVNTQEGCEAKICDNVRVAGTTQTTLTVSPNPVVNVIHALFYSSFNENVTINIVNSMGLVVRTYTRNAVIGPNGWDFDLSTLSTGVYSMVVISPNQFASAIFFKL